MALLVGNVGAIYKTYGTSTTFTDEATTANGDKTRYTISDSAKRYWDDSSAIVVKKNTVVQTTGFHIEYPGGVVVFDSALTSEVITVSGKYFTVEQCAGFFNWKLDPKNELKDVTVFGDTWKKQEVTLKGWSASAEGYWADETYLTLLGTKVILVLYVDSGASLRRYEGYILNSGSSINAANDDVVKQSVSFEGSGELYYREG
jgi:hypothetical protein